jgi:hypothetical protein
MYLLPPERNYDLKTGSWKVSGKESMCKGVSKCGKGRESVLWHVFEFIKNCEFGYLNDFSTREEPLVL